MLDEIATTQNNCATKKKTVLKLNLLKHLLPSYVTNLELLHYGEASLQIKCFITGKKNLRFQNFYLYFHQNFIIIFLDWTI